MEKTKIDEIREKLKINEMDDFTKKDLFNKFTSIGGKVIEETEDENIIEKMNYDDLNKKNKNITIKEQKKIKKIKKEDEKNKINIIFANWIDYISSKLNCFISNITNFKVTNFRNNFINLILFDFQNALINSRMILASVLYQDKYIASEIKKMLCFNSKDFPFYFEILYKYDNLFNAELFNQLNIIREELKTVNKAKPYFIFLFKNLYILKPYINALKISVDKALIYERDLRKLEKNITYSNIRKLYGYIDFIFYKVYPKLFILIDYYYKNDTKDKNIDFINYLELKEEDQIGFLTMKWKKELEEEAKKMKKLKEQKLNEEVIEKEENNKNDPIKKGLDLIKKYINFKQILEKFSQEKDPRILFSINDKVFLTYTLIDFFDKEFSFILNSNKVNYNIVFDFGNRIDMKKELLNNYYKLNGIYERVNEYLKILRDLKKIEDDAFLNIEEKNALHNQYTIQRSQISKIIRKETSEIVELFLKNFLYILTDYRNEKKVLQNPDDIVEFDLKIGESRICEGQKIINIIENAYYIIDAIHFLLIEGELGGISPIVENPIYLNLDNNEVINNEEKIEDKNKKS